MAVSEMTALDRVEARHLLQELMENARQARDAMDPQHGMPVVTPVQFSAQLDSLFAPLAALEAKVCRNADGST
jgi:hypothetical protein